VSLLRSRRAVRLRGALICYTASRRMCVISGQFCDDSGRRPGGVGGDKGEPVRRGRSSGLNWQLAGLLAGHLMACRQPTEIVVQVTTDVSCDDLPKTSIAVGTLGTVDATVPASSTLGCDSIQGASAIATGKIGSVVLLPAESESGPVALTLVTAFGDVATLENCQSQAMAGVSADPERAADCIIARRALHFEESRKVSLNLMMEADCAGVPCGPTTTCVTGRICQDICLAEGSSCKGTGAAEVAEVVQIAPGEPSSGLTDPAICPVSFSIGSSAISQVPAMAVTETEIVIAYLADYQGSTRWIIDRRSFDGTRKGTDALVVDPPQGATSLGPMAANSSGVALLAQHNNGLGLHLFEAATGDVQSRLITEETGALIMPEEGLHHLGDRWAFLSGKPSTYAYLVEVPSTLASHSLLQVSATGSTHYFPNALSSTWDGTTLTATWLEGLTAKAMIASSEGSSWAFAPQAVTGSGASGVQRMRSAASATQRIATWDSMETGSSQVSFALLAADMTQSLGPTVLGVGTNALPVPRGSAWSVLWQRPTATGREVVRQVIDSTGGQTAAAEVLVYVAPDTQLRSAAIDSGSQALTWWDEATSSIQLAVCN
jgi:hypothetical protein